MKWGAWKTNRNIRERDGSYTAGDIRRVVLHQSVINVMVAFSPLYIIQVWLTLHIFNHELSQVWLPSWYKETVQREPLSILRIL